MRRITDKLVDRRLKQSQIKVIDAPTSVREKASAFLLKRGMVLFSVILDPDVYINDAAAKAIQSMEPRHELNGRHYDADTMAKIDCAVTVTKHNVPLAPMSVPVKRKSAKKATKKKAK